MLGRHSLSGFCMGNTHQSQIRGKTAFMSCSWRWERVKCRLCLCQILVFKLSYFSLPGTCICIRLLVGLNDIVSLSDYRQIYNSHTKLSKGRSCMHLDSMFCARFPLAPTSHPNSPSCASPLTSELHHRQTNFIGNDKPPI